MGDTNLAKYGGTFQSKVIACLITDNAFLSAAYDVLDEDFFESQANKWIVGEIKNYFAEFASNPTLDVFKVQAAELDDDVLKRSVVDNLKQAWRVIGSVDSDYVKGKFLEFCKFQKLKTAIIDSAGILEIGDIEDYQQISDKINTALQSGNTESIGHDYVLDVDKRISEIARNTVQTGWDIIDELMDGGLAPGELGVIVAPSGVGKSWALCNIAAYAAWHGKTVIHYSLELGENYVGKRYDSIFTKVTVSKLPDHIDDIKEITQTMKGRLIIKYYPTKTASPKTILSHLKRAKAVGISPDLIIIDYGDLLKGNSAKRDKRHEELGELYEELRSISGAMGIPIWTASQSNRSSIDMEIIQADSVAASYEKVMTADFIMSISRKSEDKINNTARMHIIKNRFGADGMTLPSKMDASIGKIDIFHPGSSGGILADRDAKGGKDIQKKMLAKKFKELT